MQYNTADLGYRYIVYYNILLYIAIYVLQYIASVSDDLNAEFTKMN